MDVKTNLTIEVNSFFQIIVCDFHLLVKLSMVNLLGCQWIETTSKEKIISELAKLISESFPYRSKLFRTWPIPLETPPDIIFCKNHPTLCKAVFTKDTINLKGRLSLCIFGSPYAFGKSESLDFKYNYSFLLLIYFCSSQFFNWSLRVFSILNRIFLYFHVCISVTQKVLYLIYVNLLL